MKKKYMFTKDSSFTHVKDAMYKSATEHIVEDDETKDLYHHVVSYGGYIGMSSSSVFMSHLLAKIGVTGFGKSYEITGCKIDLPYYPSAQYHKARKAIVELPKGSKVEDIEFGRTTLEISDKFKQTFLGKTFKFGKDDEQEPIQTKYVLSKLFRFLPDQIGYAIQGDKAYPLCTIMESSEMFDSLRKRDFEEFLSILDEKEHAEIYAVLEKFAQIDIEKEIEKFIEETQSTREMKSLKKEMLYRQDTIREHLASKAFSI